jgi:hypothetical protein
MVIRSTLVLSFLAFVVFFISYQKPCSAMELKELRKNQEDIVNKAREQIEVIPEETRHIQRKILLDTREEIERPSAWPASPLAAVKERIDMLLSKQQISPEEIHVLRKDMEKIARDRASGIERSEYENLMEKLDIAYGFTKSIVDLRQSQASLLEKLNNNFDAVADTGEKATLWKQIFSGGFTVSFLANLIAVCGFMIKVPNAKLEKQLKELMIIEKKAKLKQDGII